MVEAVRFSSDRATVYNLSVADTSNYYVGPNGVLAHNCSIRLGAIAGDIMSDGAKRGKGIHFHIDNIEVSLRPDHLRGYGVFRTPGFNLDDAQLKEATKLIDEWLSNPSNKQKLISKVRTAMAHAKQNGHGAYLEFRNLLEALER